VLIHQDSAGKLPGRMILETMAEDERNQLGSHHPHVGLEPRI
jgi:hypothetical protein